MVNFAKDLVSDLVKPLADDSGPARGRAALDSSKFHKSILKPVAKAIVKAEAQVSAKAVLTPGPGVPPRSESPSREPSRSQSPRSATGKGKPEHKGKSKGGPGGPGGKSKAGKGVKPKTSENVAAGATVAGHRRWGSLGPSRAWA